MDNEQRVVNKKSQYKKFDLGEINQSSKTINVFAIFNQALLP